MEYPDMTYTPLTHIDWTRGQVLAENLKHTCARCKAIDFGVDASIRKPLCKPCHNTVTSDNFLDDLRAELGSFRLAGSR